MKAIIIARVSTEEQKEAGLSLPAQVMRLENYCQNRNFAIIKSFSFDESAYKDERGEFDRIFEFIIQQKEKVAICCDKVDRLSRNMFDKRVSFLYDKALQDEIELHFISDGQIINSKISAAEKFHFGISLGLAKYYSDAISDNVKRALEQKLRKGEWPAKAPYGYKNITTPDDKADVIVDEYASCIIQKAFELYATSAFSMSLLCEKINRDYGVAWSKGYLDHILKHQFYAGTMLWNNKEYPHRYPPLISTTLFEQVQQVKKNFNKKPVKYAGLPYIYRGLIRCGECGLAITPEKHKGYIYYHCTQYNGKHDAQWLREEEITNQLGTVFKNMQIPKEIFKQIIETLNSVHQDKVEFHNKHFDKLTKEHKDVTLMMDNLYLDKLKGRITESEYDRFYTTLRDKLTDLNIQLSQLQEAEDNYYMTAKYLLDLSSRAYDLFMSSEVEEKRQLIKLILSNLRIEEKKVLFDAVKPFDLILNSVDSQAWCAQ
jgi:site-specific DNA recombinase